MKKIARTKSIRIKVQNINLLLHPAEHLTQTSSPGRDVTEPSEQGRQLV